MAYIDVIRPHSSASLITLGVKLIIRTPYYQEKHYTVDMERMSLMDKASSKETLKFLNKLFRTKKIIPLRTVDEFLKDLVNDKSTTIVFPVVPSDYIRYKRYKLEIDIKNHTQMIADKLLRWFLNRYDKDSKFISKSIVEGRCSIV